MKPRAALYIAAVLSLALAGCVPLAAAPAPTQARPSPPAPTPSSLAAVVMGAAERCNAGDLEGLMAYWADDAVFYMFGMPPTGSEVAKGREQIRAVFEENIANHSRWEIEIETVIDGIVNTRSKNWHDFTRQIGVAPLEASGVFVIRDGKIATHAWILTEDSAARLKTALAEAAPAEPKATALAPTPAAELAVTISGGTCSYNGPLALRAGEVRVAVDVRDEGKAAYAITFLTLEPGKDFMDLMATTAGAGPPTWAKLLHYEEVGPGESKTYAIAVTEGPVYAVCWSKPPDLPIGNLGPFEVSQ
jgi:hypothetical protein